MKLEEAKITAAIQSEQAVDCVRRIAGIPLAPGEVIRLAPSSNQITSAAASQYLTEAKLLCKLGASLTNCGLEMQARLWCKEEPKLG